jgi:hypothetical protein
MASAKLANSTVNHSHSVICRLNLNAPPRLDEGTNRRMVVRTLPTSTTNMTGFFIMLCGASLTSASVAARRMIAGSNRERFPLAWLAVDMVWLR